MCISLSRRNYLNLQYAVILNNISVGYKQLNNFQKALKYSQRAYNIYYQLYGPDHFSVQAAEMNIGIY